MPIFEYQCQDCEHHFEKLVFGGKTDGLTCPQCDSLRVDKQFSTFAFNGQGIRSSAQTDSCGSCAASSCSGCSSKH